VALTTRIVCIWNRNDHFSGWLQVADAPKPALWRRRVEPFSISARLSLIAALSKKETLEANLGNGVKFIVTVTLLMYLSGMEPDAKPELHNFRFTRITNERGPESCSPMAKMPKYATDSRRQY
jgi:hypothetical protein